MIVHKGHNCENMLSRWCWAAVGAEAVGQRLPSQSFDSFEEQGLIDKGVFEACEGALICTGTTAFPTARCVPCVRVHGHDDYCSCQEYSAYLLRGLHDRILDPHANPRLLYRAPVKTKADSGAGGKETMDLSRPTSYPRRTWSRLFRAR